MRVGTPSETKRAERRVGLTPASVRELEAHGHDVVVQRGAGWGIGAADEEYVASGARLNNATLPYVLALADEGWRDALRAHPHLQRGLNVCGGRFTEAAVAEALGREHVAPSDLLSSLLVSGSGGSRARRRCRLVGLRR